MNEHDEVGTRLASALHAEAETVRPEPALQSILARTRSAPARSRRLGWWPALAGAVAAGALVAVALVVFGGSPTSEPGPVASQRETTVYMLGFEPGDDARLFPEEVVAPNTGDPGVDAVNALLTHQPDDPDYTNVWANLNGDADPPTTAPIAVTSVIEADGAVYVDFSGPIDYPWGTGTIIDWLVFDSKLFTQQLVYTVQTTLDTADPLVITRDGTRVESVLAEPVSGISQPDPYALAPVQIESPAQGETVSSPVTVSGQSATFEGNVVWRVKQDGDVVEHGFTTSQGASGVFGPFEFSVDLPPGDYTVEAYEESAENGEIINLDSKDFTVE